MLKNLGLSILYFFGFVLISSIVITLLNYFNVFSNSIISILKFLVPVVGIAISGFILGKNSIKKGYIEGLKLGTIIILLFFIINIAIDKFNVRSIIYYLILIFSSILSSMVGINKKKVTD